MSDIEPNVTLFIDSEDDELTCSTPVKNKILVLKMEGKKSVRMPILPSALSSSRKHLRLNFEEQQETPCVRVGKKVKHHGWSVGDLAHVRLTDLDGYSSFQYCHMEGVIETLTASKATVKLIQLHSTVNVALNRLSPATQPEQLQRPWKAGDKVHVLQNIDGVEGWWEAFIMSASENNFWNIQWAGQYADWSDEQQVAAELLRVAN